jgi:predicted tellurium resistance membrane protein TerC
VADIPISAWAALGVVVVVLLAVDLLVFARRRAPSLRESIGWSIGWLAIALVFGGAWWLWQGGEAGSQFFAGYLLERSLSLDNVFVFAVILSYFAVPRSMQPRVLGWGIVLALGLRLVFILVGAALLDAFHATFYVFGALLLYTAYRIARQGDEEVDPGRNPVLRLVRLPTIAAAFVAVAITDVIFAIDSIPAIFAITREPFIVFAANAFAMLGLRALYFLLAGMRERFIYLSHGLAAILGFIGVKMLLVDVWHVPIWLSLAVIVVVLGVAAAVSMRATRRPRLAR